MSIPLNTATSGSLPIDSSFSTARFAIAQIAILIRIEFSQWLDNPTNLARAGILVQLRSSVQQPYTIVSGIVKAGAYTIEQAPWRCREGLLYDSDGSFQRSP